jgi:hypothetical protein
MMENFFGENGGKNLLFYYSEPDSSPSQPTAQTNKPILRPKVKLQIMHSSDMPLRGICVYFVRISNAQAISAQNIAQVNNAHLKEKKN